MDRGKAQRRSLANPDLVDVVRRNPGLHGQHVAARDDEHDYLGGADDASYRMHGELMYATVLRRANVDAHELILGRNTFFAQLRRLRPDVRKLLAHLAAKVLIDLQNLQPGFGYLALGLRNRGDEDAAFSFQ